MRQPAHSGDSVAAHAGESCSREPANRAIRTVGDIGVEFVASPSAAAVAAFDECIRRFSPASADAVPANAESWAVTAASCGACS